MTITYTPNPYTGLPDRSGSSTSPITLFDYKTNSANIDNFSRVARTSTIAAGQLANDGDKLLVKYSFYTLYTGTYMYFTVRFGGQVIWQSNQLYSNNAAAGQGADGEITSLIIRDSASSIRAMTKIEAGYLYSTALDSDFGFYAGHSGSALVPKYIALGGLTLANTNVLNLAMQSDRGDPGDIVTTMGTVLYIPAAA